LTAFGRLRRVPQCYPGGPSPPDPRDWWLTLVVRLRWALVVRLGTALVIRLRTVIRLGWRW